MATFLVDTNLLLRLSDKTSSSRDLVEQAIGSLRLRGDLLCITAQNIVEFWAVATRPLEANGLGWTTQRTGTEVEQLLNTFRLLQDSPDILTHWQALVTAHDIKGKKTHDARLVAVMQAHGVTHLLTFNTDDFKGYHEITLIHPTEV